MGEQPTTTTREVSCSQAKETALRVMRTPKLADKVFLEGGLVPWIITGNDSGRQHGDVDFSVRLADMPSVRAWLKDEGLFDQSLDSTLIPCNETAAEYGIHAFIGGVLVSFAPFFSNGKRLIQRNAEQKAFAGYDALLEASLVGLAEEDFVEMRDIPNGLRAGFTTLECCRAAKLTSDRAKDLADLSELDHLGYNQERMQRVAAAFATLQITCPAHSA